MPDIEVMERARAHRLRDKIAFCWNMDRVRDCGITLECLDLNATQSLLVVRADPAFHPGYESYAALVYAAQDFTRFLHRFGYC